MIHEPSIPESIECAVDQSAENLQQGLFQENKGLSRLCHR
jgi:hypothetical protein